jgi:hypothetical protein
MVPSILPLFPCLHSTIAVVAHVGISSIRHHRSSSFLRAPRPTLDRDICFAILNAQHTWMLEHILISCELVLDPYEFHMTKKRLDMTIERIALLKQSLDRDDINQLEYVKYFETSLCVILFLAKMSLSHDKHLEFASISGDFMQQTFSI